MEKSREDSVQSVKTEQAVSWFLRIQEGLSQSGFRQWRRWFNEDESHASVFDGVDAFWQTADRMDKLPWPSAEELAADTYDGTDALVLPDKPASTAHPNKGNRGKLMGLAASLFAASLIITAIVQAPRPVSGHIITATAEHKTIDLEDGSIITLGAASEVTFTYTAEERKLELRNGEAHFNVAKDPQRPFTVAAGSRTVQALGTAFEINIGVRDIRVSVLEGRVRVEGPAAISTNPPIDEGANLVSDLATGDVLEFNGSTGAPEISEVDPMLTGSWMHGHLAYIGEPLESVIADVNRYHDTELIIGDQATRDLIFTGTIFADDIQDWLAGLESVFPLRMVPVEGHGILLIQSSI